MATIRQTQAGKRGARKARPATAGKKVIATLPKQAATASRKVGGTSRAGMAGKASSYGKAGIAGKSETAKRAGTGSKSTAGKSTAGKSTAAKSTAAGKLGKASMNGRANDTNKMTKAGLAAKPGSVPARGKRANPVMAKTKTELYAMAQRRDLPGRSKMGRAELARALGVR